MNGTLIVTAQRAVRRQAERQRHRPHQQRPAEAHRGWLWRWSLVGLALGLALIALGGCSHGESDTTGHAEQTLPALVLTDETPELLLTWIDERGATHTGVSLNEVPKDSKQLVRVVTAEAGHGSLFYVADLTDKHADGSYAVRTMTRVEWEQRIAKRREAYRAAHAPPPAPKATATGQTPPAAMTGVHVVLYGASWCGPCHQAAAYLKKRGIRFVEYDIEKQPARAKEMQRKLHRAGKRGGSIPVIDVGGIILQGFSPAAIEHALARVTKGRTHL